MTYRRRHRQIEEEGRWRIFGKVKSDDDPTTRRDRDRRESGAITQLKARNAASADEEDPAASSSPPSSSSSSSIGEILVVVAPLLLIYISNQWSRYSISYLVDFSAPDGSAATSAFEAMNVDLQFTQSQYGLLASTAFTILFALSSLIAGDLADRNDRKVLTLGSCAVWTLATVWTARAQSYEEVLVARVIMGGACAFSAPAAYTLISNKVSKDKLAFSNSIYSSGVYLGGALSSLSLLLDESVGWRGTMGFIGGFGALSAIAAGILLPSDRDRDVTNSESKEKDLTGESMQPQQAEEEVGLVQNALQILSIPRLRFLFLASFFRFCSGLLIGVWKAPYFKQAFPANASEFSVVNALIIAAIGGCSGIVGGYIADGLGTWIKETDEGEIPLVREYFDEQTIKLILPIVGSVLAVPTFYLTTHTMPASSEYAFEIAMLWLASEYLVAECWFGPTIAVLQSTVGASKAGTAQGMFVLTGAVGNLAPTLLGWVYGNQIAAEQSSSSSEVLANLLSFGVCAGYLLSAVFFAASVSASGESTKDVPAKQNQQ